MTAATDSAVIVVIPEIEPVVAELRSRLDRNAALGVPAHVTVLAPFLSPGRIGPERLRELAEAVHSVPRFEVTFRRSEWFGDNVLWLAPEPDDGFRALTATVSAAFPDCQPYGGAFTELVPHLTVGAHTDLARMRDAARAMSARLPVKAAIHAAHLYQGHAAPHTWQAIATLPLGPRGPRG